MNRKQRLQRRLWKVGFQIDRFNAATHVVARLGLLLKTHQINVVLDVGANTGQFSEELRQQCDYTGKIFSFEPLSSAFAELKAASDGDPDWQANNFALGAEETQTEIHIAGNSHSSSLLNMLPTHEQVAPQSRYTGSETIQVRPLDALYDELCGPTDKVFLKIDTQGYEEAVLKGAAQSLQKIKLVELELSLVPLYDGAKLLPELLAQMSELGFRLIGVDSEFTDLNTGHVLQANGLFVRDGGTAGLGSG